MPKKLQSGSLIKTTPVKHRDLFKSTLNFREMCTGTNQDLMHVGSARRKKAEEVDPRYHTRRSTAVVSNERKLSQRRSPTKKVTEQDEQVLIDKVREEEEFLRDPYRDKKSLMILPEKRLRAMRPTGVRDVHQS